MGIVASISLLFCVIFLSSFNTISNNFSDKLCAFLSNFGFNVWKWNNIKLDNYYLEQEFIIPNEAVEQDIEHAILSNLHGVRVLCQPTGSGTSTSLFRVIKKLKSQPKAISNVIYTSFSNKPLNNKLSLYEHAFPFLPWPLSSHLSISDYMTNHYSKPIVIILDHFDHARSHDDVKQLLLSLAHDSVETKKYVVLVLLSDPTFAHEILNLNGGEKFYNVQRFPISKYQWTNENLLELLHYQLKYKYPARMCSNNTDNISISNMNQMIELVQLARTPAFVKYAVNFYVNPFTNTFQDDQNNLHNNAEKLADDWNRIVNGNIW